MLTSYNGWPASKDQAEIGVKSYLVPGTQRKLRCASAAAPLLIGFAFLSAVGIFTVMQRIVIVYRALHKD